MRGSNGLECDVMKMRETFDVEKVLVDKKLLNVKEFCAYLGIGQTKARELLTKTDNPYTIRLGGRLYANKILLDKWIDSISGNKI